MTLTLKAIKRDPQQKEKEKFLDGKQMIKGVVYGNNFGPFSIWVVKSDFLKVYKDVGESSLLDLDLEGEKEPLKVLVKEVQVHPVHMTARHVDFQVIDINKPFQVNIPLEFVGVSEAVKQGGDLIKVLNSVEIECLPKELPHNIEVDISQLKTLSDAIKIADLNLPPSAKVVNYQPEDIVVEVKAHLVLDDSSKENQEENPANENSENQNNQDKKEE